MCLISLAYQVDNEYPLIVVANRDELLARPSAPSHFWPDTGILAGRDLQAGGTWMGITREGRFAGITNYRAPDESPGPLSRGQLVSNFLQGHESSVRHLKYLTASTSRYSGYNLLFGYIDELMYFSNRSGEARRLERGIYGLSNHLLNTPWPKVVATNQALKQWLQQPDAKRRAEQLFTILADQTPAKNSELPKTGISINLEKALSARFIRLPHYATRTSTILLISKTNDVTFIERSFIYPDIDAKVTERELVEPAVSDLAPSRRETRQFTFALTPNRP